MTRRAGAALFLAMAILFLVANRAAYKGYFSDDDLDNISWTRDVSLTDYGSALVTPRFLGNNFRPVGHFFYRQVSSAFGLDFPKYVWGVHLLHFVNVWLVWLLARRLGAGALAASLGTLLFAFHMAVFDAYWKPMYIFDVLCALFSLTSLLLYSHRRWVLSFAAFWLAYKSKELAVMLPAVLFLYEYWFGERKWWRLAPFFVASLAFGLQGVFTNPNRDNAYALHFTIPALATSAKFYASKVLLIPYGGAALLFLALILRDRRVWFGLAMLALFFVPLLFLPGRLYPAYCYLPLAGMSIMASAIAARGWIAPVGLFCAVWVPLNIVELRRLRSHALYVAEDNRSYVAALAGYARKSPDTRTFVYSSAPEEMRMWGIRGALRELYKTADFKLHADEDGQEVSSDAGVAMLIWNSRTRKLHIVARKTGAPDAAFVSMDEDTPSWQLGEGWYKLEGGFRWIQPRATARLNRPEDAREFELTVNIGPDFIREIGRTSVRASLNGALVGQEEYTKEGWQTSRWRVPPGAPGPVTVEFHVEPEYRASNGDPRRFGIPIAAFGFRK